MKINGSIRQPQPLSGASSMPNSPLSPETEPSSQPTTDRLKLHQASRKTASASSEADLVAKVKDQQQNVEEALPLPSFALAPKEVKYGDSGSEVARIQEVLKGLGEFKGEVNGRFDRATELAVMSYQRRFGLPDNGVVGAETWQRAVDHEVMLRDGLKLILGSGQDTTLPKNPTQPEQKTNTTAAKSPFSADNTTDFQPDYRLQVDPTAPVPSGSTKGAQEYQELLSYNTLPNPHSLSETRRMANKAQVYQLAMQTQKLELSVDGGARRIKVTMPAGIDPKEALNVVRRMYEESNPNHRKAIKEVNLFSGPNPLDEYYELQNRWPSDFVSAMTGGNGVINFYNVGSQPQRQELWDHELAHVYMQNAPEASSEIMVPKGWVDAIASDCADKDHEYVSGYAKTNNKEDFAETYRYYLDAKRKGKLDQFHRDYPNRALLLDRLFR